MDILDRHAWIQSAHLPGDRFIIFLLALTKEFPFLKLLLELLALLLVEFPPPGPFSLGLFAQQHVPFIPVPADLSLNAAAFRNAGTTGNRVGLRFSGREPVVEQLDAARE